MTNGPIEFLGEEPLHEVGETEFGGVDGLIQPARDDGAFLGSPESKGGHADLYSSEVNTVMSRRARMPLVGREQVDGVSADGEAVVDPVTGREVPADRMEDGLSARLSDIKPA